MKLKLVLAITLLSSFAFAQHGGGRPSGAGAPGGAGAGMSGGNSMGASHGMSGDSSSMGLSHGQGQPGQSNSGRTPSEILTQNTRLTNNLDKLLPQGMTAQDACGGFKNLGQCVAAIHVSNNLGIPFADLKTKMTGASSESLGKAIKDLKPTVDAKAESKKAQKQAKQDIQNNS